MKELSFEDLDFETQILGCMMRASFDYWLRNRAVAHKAWLGKWKILNREKTWWEDMVH